MRRSIAAAALAAVLSVGVAAPAYAMGDDGVAIEATNADYSNYSPEIQGLMNFVYAQIGKRYVVGATGPNAFDCSGLTAMAYRSIGVPMAAYSFTQARMGRRVSRDQIQPGDLLLMSGNSHVGMAVSATEMISAANPSQGIHKVLIPGGLDGIRRIL